MAQQSLQEQLIERAFLAHEQGKDIEQKLSPEELQELWGGLKNLASRGAKAVGNAAKSAAKGVAGAVDRGITKMDNFATNLNNRGMDAIASAGSAVKGAAQATGQAVRGAQDAVVDTYRQGEIKSIVQKIHDLNAEYKKLTGKSFVRQFSAVAGAVPNAQKRAASAPAPAAPSAVMAEAYRLQKLAGLLGD